MLDIRNLHVLENNQTVLEATCFQTPEAGMIIVECDDEKYREALFSQIILKEHQFENYYFQGEEVRDEKYFLEHYLSVVTANVSWMDDLTLNDHLTLFSMRRRIRVYAWKLGLSGQMNQYPSELSSSERFRAGLVMAMALNKPILVLDVSRAFLLDNMTTDMAELLQEYSKNHLVILPALSNQIHLQADGLYQVHAHEMMTIHQYNKPLSELSIYQPVCFGWRRRLRFLMKLKKNSQVFSLLRMVLLSLLMIIICLNFSIFIKVTGFLIALWLNALFAQESLLNDCQLVCFFKQFNWQEKSVRHFLFQKYALDTLLLLMISLFAGYLYHQISIGLGLSLVYVSYSWIMMILLSAVFMFFCPIYLLKRQLQNAS